jgi:hypothetical protein
MLSDYLAICDEDPDFEPAYPVVAAGMRGGGIEPDVYITGLHQRGSSDLFNAAYELLLQMIARYFAFGHETPEHRKVPAHAAVGLMFRPSSHSASCLPAYRWDPITQMSPREPTSSSPYRASLLLPHRRSARGAFDMTSASSRMAAPGMCSPGRLAHG